MTAPAAPAAADSEDYSSEEDRQQAQRRRQKQRQKDREAQGKSKGKSRKSDAGAGEGGKLVAPAAGLGGQGEEEWSQWASAELEQQLLDEVHTTGDWWLPWRPPFTLPLFCGRLVSFFLPPARPDTGRYRLMLGTCTHALCCLPPGSWLLAPSCCRLCCLLQNRVCDGATEAAGAWGAPHPHLLAVPRHVS